MEQMDFNNSKKEICSWYRATAAELITKQGKKPYVRLSLMKLKSNGRIDPWGFSHYFTVGIPDLVEAYKQCGVTNQGISSENLEKATAESDNIFTVYGFWYNMPLNGIYRNKETGKVVSTILMFIPCDDETGLPRTEWVPTNERIADILKNYDLVPQATAEETGTPGAAADDEGAKRKAYEEWLATQG